MRYLPLINAWLLLFFILVASVNSWGEENPSWERTLLEDLSSIMQQMEVNKVSGIQDLTYFYTGNNPRNTVFTTDTKAEVNKHLRDLATAGRKTVIFVAYGWFEYKTDKPNESLTEADYKKFAATQQKKLKKVIDTLRILHYETDNINLHVSMMIFVKTIPGSGAITTPASTSKWHRELYIDHFKPRSDLSSGCAKEVDHAIRQTITSKSEGLISKSANKAMIWRAKLLKDKMLQCPVAPAMTGDQTADMKTLLGHIKEKAEKDQAVIMHMGADGKPAIGELNAYKVKIENTEYNRIRFLNFTKKDPSFSKPLAYNIQLYENTTPKAAGFIFNNRDSTNKMLFSFTIFDDNYMEKRDSLRKYIGLDESFIHDSQREYGWLSAEFESGSNSGCAIGYDESGGCSYGAHQIATRTGTMSKFINWVNEKTANAYAQFTSIKINNVKLSSSKNECVNCAFSIDWNGLCNTKAFIDWQHNFILETHFQPIYKTLSNTLGSTELFKDMNGTEKEALIEMCVSLGVQHGSATKIFQMALVKDFTDCDNDAIIDKDNGCKATISEFKAISANDKDNLTTMKTSANAITMNEYIDRVYAARKVYLKATGIAEADGIINGRYKEEPKKLKKMLNL